MDVDADFYRENAVYRSWADGKFNFAVESGFNNFTGFRKPQRAAAFAVFSHLDSDPAVPATVVMPTGTGKTDTIFSIIIAGLTFWALKGGGGSFGVVTALEFDLLPIPDVYAGALIWPAERAAEVVHRWAEWTRTAPDASSALPRTSPWASRTRLPLAWSGKATWATPVTTSG